MSDINVALRELIRAVVREEVRAALAAATKPAEYLSTAEAAELARVVPDTVRRWIRERRIEVHRAGRELRLKRADVERMLRGEQLGEPDIEALAEEAAVRRFATTSRR